MCDYYRVFPVRLRLGKDWSSGTSVPFTSCLPPQEGTGRVERREIGQDLRGNKGVEGLTDRPLTVPVPTKEYPGCTP